MVAETKETMTKMFDCWSEGLRATFDAGRRTQETWAKTVTDATKNNPSGFDSFFATGQNAVREFGPFVGKNIETAAQTCDTAFRANMDAFRTATEAVTRPEEGDLYKRTRRAMDATFDAFRTNVDAFNKATTRGTELCSAFFQAVCARPCDGKSAAKGNKTSA